MDMSFSIAHRIFRKELKMKFYKITVEPLLNDEHKAQRKKFANWARQKFRKEDIMRIIFSDEKTFDLDGTYNSQNDCIWTINREEANRRGRTKQQEKFGEEVMVCSEGIAPLVLFEKGTRSSSLHQGSTACFSTIRKQLNLPTTQRKSRNARVVFGKFLDKETWPAKSSGLNPWNHCIGDEIAQAIDLDNVHEFWNSSAMSKIIRLDVVPFGRIVCIAWYKMMGTI